MVRLEDLYEVYFLARSNKRRSEDAVIFELDYERRLAALLVAINERTYRANRNYTFVSMRPKPREVFACELESRLIQWYVIWRILPILERTLTDRTFNNRKGMGTDAAIKRIHDDIREVSHNFTRDAYFIQWDLQGYFPNARTDLAAHQLQKLITEHYEGDDKEDLLWMVMISCNALPQKHCYRKSPREMWELIDPDKSLFNKPDGIGGAIGFLIWQVAMNLYLNDVDKWAIEEMGLHYVRFVDDTVMVVENKEAALLLLPLFRKKYAEYGCKMHPRKFYCQHIGKGVKVLGSVIKYERVYIQNRTIRNAARRISYFNVCRNKRASLDNFLDTVNSYFGLLKNRTEFRAIQRLHDSINPGWWKYLEMNWDRCCVVARDGYGYKDRLKYKIDRLN